jgi:predicted CopG family antitoxin
MNKHFKISFSGLLENFYPKSKLKFVSTFMIMFPQFTPKLEHILKSVKESSKEE